MTGNKAEREAFLAAHPGLREALECEHSIVADIKRKFEVYRSLSEKQIALVFKLDREAKEPAKPEERKAIAPTGKLSFKGEIVSVKLHDTMYGSVSFKATVKVTQPDGSVWLAWGTLPRSIIYLQDLNQDLRAQLVGKRVSVTATLEPGRTPEFARMKRPRMTLL